MVIVVVRVTASLEATGCPDLQMKAVATYSTSQSSINTTIAPSFEVDVSGAVGVGSSAILPKRCACSRTSSWKSSDDAPRG